VEPLYLAAEAGGGLPQLKRVIVAYADNVVMEATLDAALGRIFGGAVEGARAEKVAASPAGAVTPLAPAAAGADVQSLVREANQHFERAQQLLKQGDWSGYGEEMKKVGDILKQLSNSAGTGPHP
jgi:uncharacterized membrane protein (UPF0182 family)